MGRNGILFRNTWRQLVIWTTEGMKKQYVTDGRISQNQTVHIRVTMSQKGLKGPLTWKHSGGHKKKP